MQHPKASRASADPYLRFGLMLALSFLAMFALMYAMVDRFANVFVNVNQAYMAALMVVPMAMLELILMRHMYTRRGVNLAIHLGAVVIGAACWIGIRQQVGVTDQQFLRSMIPHHAGAVLMCEKVDLEDARIRELCAEIIRSQNSEINLMADLLGRSR